MTGKLVRLLQISFWKQRIKALLKHRNPVEFVGTTKISGEIQLELLKKEGLLPDSSVLEIGCGNLHAAVPIVKYLKANNYVGIDPNVWLRKSALKDAAVANLMKEKKATFLIVKDFDACKTQRVFDYIFSHSILSHAADWQLSLFLKNAKKVLAPGGRILSSIRLAEGNNYGSTGTPNKDDSKDSEWVYPGVSWFTLATVQRESSKVGLQVLVKPQFTEYYTQTKPNECHDWLVFWAD